MVKKSTTMSWVATAAVSLGASEAALKLILGQLAGVPLMLLYRALIAHRWEQKWVFQATLLIKIMTYNVKGDERPAPVLLPHWDPGWPVGHRRRCCALAVRGSSSSTSPCS